MTTSRIEWRTDLASPGFRLHPRSMGILLLLAAPLLLSLAALPLVASAQGSTQQGAPLDPPGRVGRLSLTEGAVSLAPADRDGRPGNDGWTAASLNRPLTRGDRLWTGPRARSELHIGSTAVRMSEQTSLDFLALDDDVTQLRLAQGSLKLRVRTLFEGQRLEVNTPNLAFVITQPGDYRLDVNPASDVTRVVAQSGGGVIYGDNGARVELGSRQQANYSGTQLTPAAPGAEQQDGFDAWASARDRREDRSVSARYVPRETVGYQQLDSYGDWSQDPTYGAVWQPRAVPANWAPYRAGHWSWIAPWGWTWVDDAPWGFAPFHYGRWAQIGPRWAWVPGRMAARPVYAPALVAFVGGNNNGNSGGVNWNISIGSGGQARPGLGWFPLAPGEAYQPAYRASPRYVTQVNQHIVVNNTVNVTKLYRYQRQPAAVTAASREDFVRGRPLRGSQQVLSAIDLKRAQVVREHSALPQRPERHERERPRPVAAAALPPATLAARPVVGSHDERRQERRDDRRPDEKRAENRGEKRDVGQPGRPENRLNSADDTRRAGRSDNAERNERNGRAPPPVPAPPAAVGLMGAQPPATRPVLVTPPNARPAQSPPIDRSAKEAEQKARREQPQLQREQQRQPRDVARQPDAQRAPTEASPGQRALREQPQKNGNVPPVAAQAPAAQQHHAAEQAQQLQRDQQRQQSEAAQGQRAQREQAQKQQASDQAVQAQQQQQRAQQDQQRQAREQQQKQANQQQQAQQQQRDQQRQQSEAAQGQRAQREQAQKQQASDQAVQAQQQQQRAQQDQQRQAREQQQKQASQQSEAAQGQRAQREQVQKQQQAQAQQQQQQQQRAQQEQQRQAREQPKPPPQEQQRAPDPERQKKRRADAANAAGNPQPDGEPHRNR